MKLALDTVEHELAKLWKEQGEESQAARVELMTLVALVSEPSLAERARSVVEAFVRVHPSRTILVLQRSGETAEILAEACLHRAADGRVYGDAVTLEAMGKGRQWLPENVERLALPDLPICLWWVGDLPDFDDLFDRMLSSSDRVVVNSGEMDLRDLQKLSEIVARSAGRYALADLGWVFLRPIQDIIARFFDDDLGSGCLHAIERVRIEFAPRASEQDVASTQAGLLFGWIVGALGLRAEDVRWQRADTWAEARIGSIMARFEQQPRADVPSGTVLSVSFEGGGARFTLERLEDAQTFRWSREIPGTSTPPQTMRMSIPDETSLLVRCVDRPTRDPLLESSLHVASRICRGVAPRLSRPPAAG